MNDQELRAIYDIVYAHECTFKAFATDIRALLVYGGKGEAVCDRIICWHNRSCVNDDAATMRNCPHRAAPQAECAPREAQPVDQWLRDLRRAHEYLDKGEPFFTGKDCAELADLIESLAAPTPERAPREAQPVGPRTTLNYDGTFDTPCAHCGGNGCFACLKSAAPTPERADADTAGAGDLEALLADVTAIDTWHRGSPSYEHDANWFKDRVIRLLEKRIAADASERADAEKDAARYRWLRGQMGYRRLEELFGSGSYTHEMIDARIDAAILAADKEPK